MPAIVAIAWIGALSTMAVVVACEKRAWGGLAMGAIAIAAFAFVGTELASPWTGEEDRIAQLALVAIVGGFGLGACAVLGRMAWKFEHSQHSKGASRDQGD